MSICGFVTLVIALILIASGILYIIGMKKYGDTVLYLIRIVIVSVIVIVIVYLVLFLLGIFTLDDMRRLLTVILPHIL